MRRGRKYVFGSVPILPNHGVLLSTSAPGDFNGSDQDDTTTQHPTGEDTHAKASVDASNGFHNAVYDACVLQFEFRCVGPPRVVPLPLG